MKRKLKLTSAVMITVAMTLVLFAPASAGIYPSVYCEEILGGTWTGSVKGFSGKCVFRQTNPICSKVDLPRTIENSAMQPISFKGNSLIEAASLAVPGGENLAIFGLTYEAESHTWSGFINTLYLPAGYYSPVRVIVYDGDMRTRACHFGGLTVD